MNRVLNTVILSLLVLTLTTPTLGAGGDLIWGPSQITPFTSSTEVLLNTNPSGNYFYSYDPDTVRKINTNTGAQENSINAGGSTLSLFDLLIINDDQAIITGRHTDLAKNVFLRKITDGNTVNWENLYATNTGTSYGSSDYTDILLQSSSDGNIIHIMDSLENTNRWQVRKLNTNDGNEMWASEYNLPCTSSTEIATGKAGDNNIIVYCRVGGQAQIIKIDETTGTLINQINKPINPASKSKIIPISTGGFVLLNENNELIRHNADLTENWNIISPGNTDPTISFDGTKIYIENKILFPTFSSQIFAINTETGNTDWTSNILVSPYSSIAWTSKKPIISQGGISIIAATHIGDQLVYGKIDNNGNNLITNNNELFLYDLGQYNIPKIDHTNDGNEGIITLWDRSGDIYGLRIDGTACGDGVITGTEQCDDGNTNPLDGCSATCQIEAPCILTSVNFYGSCGMGFSNACETKERIYSEITTSGVCEQNSELFLEIGTAGCNLNFQTDCDNNFCNISTIPTLNPTCFGNTLTGITAHIEEETKGPTNTVTPSGSIDIIGPAEIPLTNVKVNKTINPRDVQCALETAEISINIEATTIATRRPLDIVLVMDASGSMADGCGAQPGGGYTPQQNGGCPIQNAKWAFIDYINRLDPAMDRVGLVHFHWNTIRDSDLTNNFGNIISSITSMTTDGGTMSQEGLNEAKDIITTQGRPDSVKVILFATDGGICLAYPPNGNGLPPSGTICGNTAEKLVAELEAKQHIADSAQVSVVTQILEIIGTSITPTDKAKFEQFNNELVSIGGGSKKTWEQGEGGQLMSNFIRELVGELGGTAGSNVEIIDVLPTYVTATNIPSECTLLGNEIRCNPGDIKIGINKTINLSVTTYFDGINYSNVYPDSRIEYIDNAGIAQTIELPKTFINGSGNLCTESIPCKIDTATITPQCTGGSYTECEDFEQIRIQATLTGECPAQTYLQIDADSTDGMCKIKRDNNNEIVEIHGMNITCNNNLCDSTWTIPTIPGICSGKTMNAIDAGLYQLDLSALDYTTPSGTFTFYTNPNIPPNCGDGNIDVLEGETCDGTNLAGLTCLDFDSFTGGILYCNDDCTLNTSLCIDPDTPLCGNNIVDIGEECDGTDIPVTECSTFDPLTLGTVGCTASCQFDVSGCYEHCGDGIAQTGSPYNEQCDTTDLNGITDCQQINPAWLPGTLNCYPAGSGQECLYNDSSCQPAPPGGGFCGDGIRNGIEQCDGTDLDGWPTACSDINNTWLGSINCNPTGSTNECELNIGCYIPGQSNITVTVNTQVSPGIYQPVPETTIKIQYPGILELNNETDINGEVEFKGLSSGNTIITAQKEGYDTNTNNYNLQIGDNNIIITLINASCHADCTDFENRCNPQCSGLNFTTNTGWDTCEYYDVKAMNKCAYKVKGTQITYDQDPSGTWVINCCEGIPTLITEEQATIEAPEIDNSYKIEWLSTYQGKPVKINILVWD